MAVSVHDQRMVQQLEESQVNVEKLALSVELGAVRDFIAAEVADKSLEFRASIATEDQEELDLGQARQAYEDSQRVAVDVFRTMHAALGTGVAFNPSTRPTTPGEAPIDEPPIADPQPALDSPATNDFGV